MNAMHRIAIILLLMTLTACALPVRLDYDPAVNFSALHTYAWAPNMEVKKETGDPLAASDTLLRQRLEQAVYQELQSRGYVKATQALPDFLVTYHITSRKRNQMVVFDNYWGPGWGWGYYPYGWGYGYGMGSAYMTEMDETVFALDILNPSTHKLTWRAVVRNIDYDADTPDERFEGIRKAVRSMLQRFPPTSR